MICDKCGHTWNYKGSATYATCPNCMRKTLVRIVGEKEDQRLATKEDT